MSQHVEVLSILSGILSLAVKHDFNQLEAARAYVRARFADAELDAYLAILDGLERLRRSPTLAADGAHRQTLAPPSAAPAPAKRAPRVDIEADPESMRRELLAMLADKDFLRKMTGGPQARGDAPEVTRYLRKVLPRVVPFYPELSKLGAAKVLATMDKFLASREVADQSRVYNAVRRDYLRHRSSSLASLTKLINEEEP